MNGVILDRHAEVGSLVEPGTVAFKVADTTEMKAIFGVSDIQVEQLKQGEPQTLAAEAIPGVQLTGTITKIAPNADPTTRIFDVEVAVPNKDGKLRTGMIASLQLVQTEAPRPTEATLPLNAIVRPPHDQKDFAVYMVEEREGRSFARLREVRLGEIVGNDIMVASGVEGPRRPRDRARGDDDCRKRPKLGSSPEMAHRSDSEIVRSTPIRPAFASRTARSPGALLVGVLLWGIFGYWQMPKRKDPDIPVRGGCGGLSLARRKRRQNRADGDAENRG